MKLSIAIDMGMPEKSTKPAISKPSIEDDVREALDCIQSGHDSLVEWKMINKLYKQLREMKPSTRITNLINMMEPVMAKYGIHGTPAKDE